jgi:hypothetical protein
VNEVFEHHAGIGQGLDPRHQFVFQRERLGVDVVHFECPAVSQSTGNEAVTIDDFATVDVEGEKHPLTFKRRTAGGNLSHRSTVVLTGFGAISDVSASDYGPTRQRRSYSALGARTQLVATAGPLVLGDLLA